MTPQQRLEARIRFHLATMRERAGYPLGQCKLYVDGRRCPLAAWSNRTRLCYNHHLEMERQQRERQRKKAVKL